MIKTNHGKTLGAYSKAHWDQLGSYKSEAAFIFSLDLNQKYRPNTNQNTTLHSNSYGLYFGSTPDLYTANNCNTAVNYINQNGIFRLPEPSQLIGSFANNFACTEFEVY